MGVGNIPMDVALFMMTVFAAVVSAVMTYKHWINAPHGFALLRGLRCTGWCILSARYATVLFTTGDILISVPSAIGLCFLALGDIAIVFFTERWVIK